MKSLRAFLLLLFTTIYLFANNTVAFTEEEQTFIKNNPHVTLASGESFEPFIFKDSQGTMRGIDRDIADIIEEKTGLKIEFEVGNWNSIQERAKQREFDGLSCVTKTATRETFYTFTIPYTTYAAVVIVNRANPKKIYAKKDLHKKKASVQKGNVSFEALVKSLGDIEIIYYDSIYETLEAVVSNQVDFTISDESSYVIAEKMGIDNFIGTSFLVGEPVQLHFALSNEKPLLASIFNKALKDISPYQLRDIKNHWFKAVSSDELSLTAQEKEYLYQKKSIKLCINPDWYPFEAIEKGKHVGMSADFITLFQKKIHLPFQLIETKNWTESLRSIEEKKCDILPMAMKTHHREAYLNFTQPYFSVPLVMASQKEVAFTEKLTQLKNKRVGILEGHSFYEIIKNNYKDIDLITLPSIQEGLQKVEDGELFGFVDALASISHNIREEMRENIKISGRFDETWDLSVGVREDDPILLAIFEKLAAGITNDQKETILNKYISLTYEKGTEYTLIFQILGTSLLVIVILLFWNQQTQKEAQKIKMLNEELTRKDVQIEAQLLEMEAGRKFLKHILDNIPARVFWKDKEGRYIGANRHFLQDTGLKEFSELLGKKDSQMPWKGEEADKYRADDLRIMAKGEAELQFEESQHSADKERWVVTSKVPLKDVHDTVIGVLGIYDDITEKKLIEKELQAKDEMLMIQSRQAAMGEMSAMIAHQWRQPLATIAMELNNILLDIELESLEERTLKETALSMMGHLQYLSKTIDDFSNFFKPNKELQLSSSKEIIRETMSIVGKLLENNQIHVSIEDIIQTSLKTHPREVVQVLINILTNAKDALVQNTPEEQREIHIKTIEDEDHFIFTVSDTGGGISDAHIHYIFDPYFSTKNEKNGVGLGLYMSSMLIHKHLHGSLTCKNVTGGACFEITLPKKY